MSQLYSKNGEYPRPIPNRIVLSDGRSRTKPESFTSAEILDSGYIEVQSPPSYNGGWQQLNWNGETFQWFISDRPLEDIVKEKKQAIHNRRDRYIFSTKYVHLSETLTVPIDMRDARDIQNLTNIIQKASVQKQLNNTSLMRFRDALNEVHLLSSDEILRIGEGAFEIIDSIYTESWIKKAQLYALTTAEEAFNFDTFWPKPSTVNPFFVEANTPGPLL